MSYKLIRSKSLGKLRKVYCPEEPFMFGAPRSAWVRMMQFVLKS